MAEGLTVTVDTTDLVRALRRLGADVDAALGAALKVGGAVVQQAALKNAPGPEIEVGEPEKVRGGMQIEVGPDDEHWYYKFAETGTAPHQIEAKSAQVLRLGHAGSEFFRRRVQHSGHAASPFLRPALDENEGRVQDAVGGELKKAMPR